MPPFIDANTLGLIAGVASVDWGCAVQVMAAASIGSDMTFAPTTQQTLCVPQCAARGVNLIISTFDSGVYVAILVMHAMICSLATRVLARLQNLYIVLNILYVSFTIVHEYLQFDMSFQTLRGGYNSPSCSYTKGIQEQRKLRSGQFH